MHCSAVSSDATGPLFLRKPQPFQQFSHCRLFNLRSRYRKAKTVNCLGETMSLRGWGSFLRATSALGLLAIASTQANAGGFAVHEQSVYGQGTSFAGIAAGGALSSMFWNPATMTQFAGKGLEVGASAIFPYASNTPLPGSSLFGAPLLVAALLTPETTPWWPTAISPTSSAQTFGSGCR